MSRMRAGIILFVNSVAVAVFMGAGLIRSSRIISALRLENAALQQQLRTREVTSNGATTDLQPTVAAEQLRELVTLRAGVPEDAQRRSALTNALTENALLRRKLEELQRALVEQQSNRQPATVEAGKVSSQTSSGVPSTDSNERPWTDEQLEAYRCANQVNQITIAATLWAETHGGYGPTNFYDLHEYLAPMMLVCPAKEPKSIAHSWKNFDPSTMSY